MAASSQYEPLTTRVPTRIAGLDTILHGGFLQGGLYLVVGSPVAGKTVFGNQVCFQHVAAGGRAVYVGLLSETHTQIFAHLQTMTFFDTTLVAKTLFYYSGYGALEQEGVNGLLGLLRQVIRDKRPSVFVLDGLALVAAVADSALALQRFFHDLHASLEAAGCTGLLLTQPLDNPRTSPMYTMVDGIVELKAESVRRQTVRAIQVHKLRGSGFIEGQHVFQITRSGLVVYPRTEALLPATPTVPDEPANLPFGVAELDTMLDGGLLAGSTTMVLGVPGTGKTLLGLSFLAAGAQAGQAGLYFGFGEVPARLRYNARAIGLDIDRFATSGRLHLLWQPPLEGLLDALGEQLLQAARQHRPQRLFIDSLQGFAQAADDRSRLPQFFAAVMNELRALEVTVLYSVEMEHLFGPEVAIPIEGSSLVSDNILLLRHVELHSQLYRLISILKMRGKGHDPAIREFKISGSGITVADTFESAQAILTGLARPLTPSSRPAE